MLGLNLTISVTTINVNDLNIPLKGKSCQTQLYAAYKKDF